MRNFFRLLFCLLFLFIGSRGFSFIESENENNLPVDGSDLYPLTIPPAFDKPAADYEPRQNYDHIDPTHLIKSQVLHDALMVYDLNFEKINNQKYLTIIDFSINSSAKRFYLVTMATGEVWTMNVSIGVGSDPDGDGVANFFSNDIGSRMSSLGIYLTGEEYQGGNGRSLRMHGLSPSNSNALERLIVVHAASYVSDSDKHAGRSHGCPALDPQNLHEVVNKIRDGSLMYIWHPSFNF